MSHPDRPSLAPSDAIIAGFVAAASSLAIAPGAEAEIVNVSFDPTSLGFSTDAAIRVAGDGQEFYFVQFNDTEGKSLLGETFASYISGFREAAFGETIAPGDDFVQRFAAAPDAEGNELIGFRTASAQVGYLLLDFGGAEGAVSFLEGALNTTPNEPIVAPEQTVIPVPAALPMLGLGVLALGAVGVRRMRAA